MKIRTGFVSNSSSSSFTCLMTQKVYNSIYSELDLLSQTILEHISNETTFVGQKCMHMSWGDGNDDFLEYEGDIILEKAKTAGWNDEVINCSNDLFEAKDAMESAINEAIKINPDQVFISRKEW